MYDRGDVHVLKGLRSSLHWKLSAGSPPNPEKVNVARRFAALIVALSSFVSGGPGFDRGAGGPMTGPGEPPGPTAGGHPSASPAAAASGQVS